MSDGSVFREQMIPGFISTGYTQAGNGIFNLLFKRKKKKERKDNILRSELTSGFGFLTFMPYLYIPFQPSPAAPAATIFHVFSTNCMGVEDKLGSSASTSVPVIRSFKSSPGFETGLGGFFPTR